MKHALLSVLLAGMIGCGKPCTVTASHPYWIRQVAVSLSDREGKPWRESRGFLIDGTGEVYARYEGYLTGPTSDGHAPWFYIEYEKPRSDWGDCSFNDSAYSQRAAEAAAEKCLNEVKP
jgi:hypothetical protein